MHKDVFISYSAKDKPVAFQTCAALEARGIKCWIAPRDVKPGKEWGEAIIDAITESRVMVLIFSSNANASSQVRREVERAASSNSAIIPFRIEEVAPVKSLEFFLSSIHWLDAFPTPSDEHFKNLADSISELLPQTDGDDSEEHYLSDDELGDENPPPERTSSSALKRPLPLIIIGASVLAIAIFAIFFLSRSRNNTTAGAANTNTPTNSNHVANRNTGNANNSLPNTNGGDGGSFNYQGSMPATSYSVPESTRSIEKIIIIDTATTDMLNTMNFLTSGGRNVSYHYVIDQKGNSYSLVDEKNVAFHTPPLSKTSIGIALIHMPSKEQYTEPQRRRLIRLLADISIRYNIAPYNILTKQEVDPDRRITDLTPEMINIRNEVRDEVKIQLRKKREAERTGSTGNLWPSQNRSCLLYSSISAYFSRITA